MNNKEKINIIAPIFVIILFIGCGIFKNEVIYAGKIFLKIWEGFTS